jgi:PAS domain S-box-containing protein
MSKAGVLIVEDSFIVAYHLQATLESEGYTIMGKFDAAEAALDFIEKAKPDIVLMDIMLNGVMDGIQAATIIQSKYSIPVVYITALTDRETIQRAKITEPYGYLTKPFEDREIFTVIEMALYKHNIESKLRQSEEKYFSTVKSISDAVIVVDQDYNISYVNPSAEVLTGWMLKELQGKSALDTLLFRNDITDEFPINPIQCSVDKMGVNSMPDHLTLIDRTGLEKPVGDGSLSLILNYKKDVIGLVIIIKDLTEKNEHEKLLKDFEKKRLAALLEGQEMERSRIAKDLHDGLGQVLNAIKMNINVIVKDTDASSVLYKLIDEAIQESVRISENLLPSKLKDFDLATCLNSLCKQIGKSTQASISFQALGTTSKLEQNKKINFYRIAQEAVNNAIKHSNANSIVMQLNEDRSQLRLSIEDDGLGLNLNFAKSDYGNKNGLINMRERAEIMGGRFSIESDGKRGTLVIVEVPLENN